MHKTRSFRFAFLAAFVLSMALVVTVSAQPASVSQPLPAAHEQAVVGGDSGTCDFANGVAAGLGIATLFGCGACGAGAVVIKLGTFLAC